MLWKKDGKIPGVRDVDLDLRSDTNALIADNKVNQFEEVCLSINMGRTVTILMGFGVS